MLAGLAIAMPIGPIDLVCIHNSIRRGMFYGFMTGIGVAFADAFCGALAGLGMVAIQAFFDEYRSILQWVGGFFLCGLGIVIFVSKASHKVKEIKNSGYLWVALTTFFLTVANPLIIISLAAIYAGLGINHEAGSIWPPIVTTIGVFLGSALWWLILSSFAAYFKERVGRGFLNVLHKISGSLIFGFGVFVLWY